MLEAYDARSELFGLVERVFLYLGNLGVRSCSNSLVRWFYDQFVST